MQTLGLWRSKVMLREFQCSFARGVKANEWAHLGFFDLRLRFADNLTPALLPSQSSGADAIVVNYG